MEWTRNGLVSGALFRIHTGSRLMSPSISDKLTQLGQVVAVPQAPNQALLETVANAHTDTPYVVRFVTPEFTVLCPVTSQPDFAHIIIDYIPNKKLIESKSLKLFFASFRNQKIYHEDCTLSIAKRITSVLQPTWLRIGGYWYPRGGMPIDVFWQTGVLPEGVWLPDQGVSPYRGRT